MAPSFVKTAGYGDNLPGEAAALRWLAEAEVDGGIRVVRVIRATDDVLEEERVITGAPTAAAARRIGAGLAHMHASGAAWYGCAPDGWQGDPWCGRARTPYVAREDAAASWGAFFAEHRIMNYVKTLVDRGDFDAREQRLFERELVLVNSLPARGPGSEAKEDDIISVRGYGRFQYLGGAGETRKGRLKARVRVY